MNKEIEDWMKEGNDELLLCDDDDSDERTDEWTAIFGRH